MICGSVAQVKTNETTAGRVRPTSRHAEASACILGCGWRVGPTPPRIGDLTCPPREPVLHRFRWKGQRRAISRSPQHPMPPSPCDGDDAATLVGAGCVFETNQLMAKPCECALLRQPWHTAIFDPMEHRPLARVRPKTVGNRPHPTTPNRGLGHNANGRSPPSLGHRPRPHLTLIDRGKRRCPHRQNSSAPAGAHS